MADCRIARGQSRCADAGAWILAHRRAGFSRYTGWRRSDKQDRSGFQSEASRRGRIADPSGLAKYRARRRWRSDGPPGLARQGALVQILGFEWLAHAGCPEWTHSALDSGLSRLLGLFSVQNWARFLTLSERGAFGPGLDFDRIHATGTIHRGILQSGHFEMDGQNARIIVEGRIDLAARTQDLRVTLLPVFKADAAALAAVAIHPFIGMGGYVVQWALLPPLANYFMRQYAVTG